MSRIKNDKKYILLKKLGIKDTAAQIYLYLLENKKASVLQVSRETGIARTNVYHNLSYLIEMGLVGEAIEGTKKYLIPEHPDNLINYIKAQENVAKEVATLLGDDFLKNRYESKIRFASGPEGFKKFAEIMLNTEEKIIRQILSPEQMNNYATENQLRKIWAKRTKKGILAKVLIPEKEIINKIVRKRSKKTDILQLREIRILPKQIDFNVSFAVYDNKVNFFSPKEEDYIFLFESPAFSSTIKSIFDFIWKTSITLEDYQA